MIQLFPNQLEFKVKCAKTVVTFTSNPNLPVYAKLQVNIRNR